MERPVMMTVAAAALIDERGHVLVQRRPVGRSDAGLWELPGGKVDPGETPAAAVVRELQEELGITVDPVVPVAISFAANADVVLLLYGVRRWSGQPRPLHAEALAWHRPASLAALPMPALDRPLLPSLIAFAAT